MHKLESAVLHEDTTVLYDENIIEVTDVDQEYPVMTPLEIENFVSSPEFFAALQSIVGETNMKKGALEKAMENPCFAHGWHAIS